MLILVCIASLVLYAALIVLRQFTYWKRRKILHLELIPIIGNNAPIFFRTLSFASHFRNLYNKHPDARYFGFFDLNKPTVLIKDPEIIRDIFVKSFDCFTDHDAFVTEEMDPIVGRNIFSLKGNRWKDVRNTLTPSYTSARMKMLFSLVAECSNDFVQYLVDHPEVAKTFEAKNILTRYTNDVIASAAFGVKVNSMKDQNNEFYLHGKAFTNVSALSFVKFLLMQFFPKLMRLCGATFLPRSTNKFFQNLIKSTVTTRLEKGIIRQDMMQLLIQAMKKDDGIKVTMDDIIGQAFFFFLAGFESTSSLMCFTLQELAANPDIQEKLREEIDTVIQNEGGQLIYESLGKMKYLDMVINETLRKYPPVGATTRVCVKEHVFPPAMEGYAEYHMEVGTHTLISIFGMQRDPKYFPDPEKFDPERFNDNNKHKINPYVFMPFGIGPRQCIANRFALMEAKIVIIDILRKFVVKFTEKSQHPVSFDNKTFILTAEKGIVRPDTIQLLMQAMDKEDGIKVTMDDIMGQAFIFFLAGFDTTSSLMAFMAIEVAANLDVQEKLQREIDQHLDKDTEKLTYNSLSNMKYLDMVVSETLRKYPPAPMTNRVCTNDHIFSPPMDGYPEYNMEKDTLILIPIYALHRDSKYFLEPEKFIPERFSDENKSKIKPYTYMPFGFGPRHCIGNRFALMETKILMVHILRKFSIKFTDKTVFPIEFVKYSFNIGAEGKFWLRFEERKKIN